jgi:hypothetical protein
MCHMYINNLLTLGDAKDLRRLTAPGIQICTCRPVSLPQSMYKHHKTNHVCWLLLHFVMKLYLFGKRIRKRQLPETQLRDI